MAQWLEALGAPTEEAGFVPSTHTGQFTTTYNSSSRGFNFLFSSLKAQGMYVVHIHTCRQKIHTCKIKINIKTNNPESCGDSSAVKSTPRLDSEHTHGRSQPSSYQCQDI